MNVKSVGTVCGGSVWVRYLSECKVCGYMCGEIFNLFNFLLFYFLAKDISLNIL